uniref:BREX-1 system adenine-specific DNA-methyltransferase PglX n=1 Tax=Paracoccus binzhouensis TaxID=2796149 RepID=UPI0018EED044
RHRSGRKTLAQRAKSGDLEVKRRATWGMSVEKLRGKLLSKSTFLSMAHLGERAFDSIGGAVVSTTAFVVCNARYLQFSGDFLRLTKGKSEAEKANLLVQAVQSPKAAWHFRTSAQDLGKIPGSPIAYWLSPETLNVFETFDQLKEHAHPRQGMATTNNDLFLRQWHEVKRVSSGFGLSPEEAATTRLKWFPVNKGGEFRKWYGNNFFVVNYENQGQTICDYIDNTPGVRVKSNGRVINRDRYFREGLTWSTISTGDFALRYSPQGSIFETKGAMIFFDDALQTKSVLGILNTKITSHLLQATSPTLDFHEGPIGRLPILISGQTINDAATSRAGQAVSIAKSDWDAYETSWDFTTLPLLSPEHRGETLEDSYAALRTHWQSMTEEMQRLEEENNRIFIDAYGLQDELTPEVPLNEITLTCNPAYRYGVKNDVEANEARLRADTMAEFLSYAVGCMFGRYSLDEPGLILANQGERLEDYLARIPEPSFMPDADNVIPVLDENWFADDITERFRLFLRVTFGEAHFRENLRYIEDALGKDIRKYFTKDFYADHVKRYKKRPIYWMFSSPKGTFNALIYMHRYRGDTVSVLLNDYLREFISKLEGERGRLEKLSDDPSANQGQRTKALKDMAVIAKQIDELNEWERDVVFPLAQAKIEIDLDDGVKANYPKFGAALKKIPGLEAKDD